MKLEALTLSNEVPSIGEEGRRRIAVGTRRGKRIDDTAQHRRGKTSKLQGTLATSNLSLFARLQRTISTHSALSVHLPSRERPQATGRLESTKKNANQFLLSGSFLDETYFGSIDGTLLGRWMKGARFPTMIPEPNMMTISNQISMSVPSRE